MKRLFFLILLIPLCLSLRLSAQEFAPDPDDTNLVDRPHAQDWTTDIDRGWPQYELKEAEHAFTKLAETTRVQDPAADW